MRSKIIVYGLGKDYKENREYIESKYEVAGVSDSDITKQKYIDRFIPAEKLSEAEFDFILIATTDYYSEIKERLRKEGIKEQKIIGMEGNVINLGGGENPLIVIKLMGGMGNVMFQYAVLMRLKQLNPDVPIKVDLSYYDGKENVWLFETPWQLERLFHIELSAAAEEEITRSRRQKRHFEHKTGKYEGEIDDIREGYVWGYWLSSKYFVPIADKIRELYTFDLRYLSKRQREFYEKIQKSKNSVAIWVRRGDYLDKNNVGSYGGICTEKYYENAMNYMKESYKDAEFFVFSNDAGYIREKYGSMNIMAYDAGSTEFRDYDMFLMSQCRHMIIANSTFSWWAAWLHGDNGGTVICPKRFLNGEETPDLWEDSWIKL